MIQIELDPPDNMESPHWCECGWRAVDPAYVWVTCEVCGYVGIPDDTVDDVPNLLLAFADGMDDIDWGPFHWHPDTHRAVRTASDRVLSFAVQGGDRHWMELVAPELERRLPKYSPEDWARMLSIATPRWRDWLVRRFHLHGGDQPAPEPS